MNIVLKGESNMLSVYHLVADMLTEKYVFLDYFYIYQMACSRYYAYRDSGIRLGVDALASLVESDIVERLRDAIAA